jgi:energy-coupling factor transporter transmembrane protein EcfT
MIDVARIDYWAATGSGPFHRASVAAKAAFVLMVVVASGLTTDPRAMAAVYGLLLALAALSRLPWLRILILSLYPALFAALYGVSMEGGMRERVMLMLKAVTPALAAIMLIVSTPYPKIFSLLGRALPEIVAAGLFMTYRTFFILIDMMNNFIIALRLRGGLTRGRIITTIANIPRGIAMLLVAAVERSSRLHAVMMVRGYNGSMADTGTGGLRSNDWLPLGAGVASLGIVLAWR